MENQKPEALRLAEWCEENSPSIYRQSAETAKELRRLHARVQELEAMLEAVGAGGVSAQRITQADARDACEGIPTEALKDEAPRSCVTGKSFLQEEDQRALHRLIETLEDNEGFDIGKEAIKRLANLGVVESFGFGRYGVTMFGYWVHEHYWHQNPSLPLKTNLDRDADARAAIAAAKEI